ncbi:MAG TPA: ATP-binding protein, partial [Burkholderiaceae bacterium]|nr:ATP-binding protein [Burkholderiaceae bacterium]
SAETLLNIVSDVLDLSKIESGQLKLDLQDFDLVALTENLLVRFAPLAHAKGIELVGKLSPTLPAVVHGDPARLRQILTKLLDNALKFTERGEVALKVEALAEPAQTRDEAAATLIRFEVRDTGVGMRPQTLEQIFATPLGGELAPPHYPGSTGLGLTLCHRLVQFMGGRIGASSRIGEGSTFHLELPLALGDRSANAQPLDGRGVLVGKRVLIAEDNLTNRRVLCEHLTALAMDCAVAENGRQALQMLRIAAGSASPFDVAVIDMKMPHMDGTELTEKIRSDPSLRALRVIMLTSLAGCANAGHAPSAGVDAYLLKPVRHQDLLAALTAAMGTIASIGSGASAVNPAPALAPVALPVVDTERRTELGARSVVAFGSPRKVLEKRVLDEIVVMERNGDKDLLRRLVANYETSSKSLVQTADLSLANRDGAGVVQALRSLKLSSANLGALRFSRACGEIETLARQQRLVDAQLRWSVVRAQHESVLLALRALFTAATAADEKLQEVSR